MAQLNKTAITVIKLACFSLFVLLSLNSSAWAQNTNQPPDMKAIFENQPPFTENELTTFIVDFPKARVMADQKQAIKYLSEQGWTPGRLTYVAAKVSVTREIVRRGGTQEVINQLPKQVRPQKGELALVKKYQKQIDAMQ